MYHLALFPSYLFQKLHFFYYFFSLPSARAMLHVQLNLLDILLVDRRGNQASDSIGHSLGYASSKYSGECLFCLSSYLVLSCLVLLSLVSASCLELCLASHLLPSLTFSSYLITPLLPSISVPSSSPAFLVLLLYSFLPSVLLSSVLASLFLFLCFFLLSSFRACFLTTFVSCILESQYPLDLITSSYYITPLLFSEGKGCIVDSGTTDTYLPREFLEKFSEIFEV